MSNSVQLTIKTSSETKDEIRRQAAIANMSMSNIANAMIEDAMFFNQHGISFFSLSMLFSAVNNVLKMLDDKEIEMSKDEIYLMHQLRDALHNNGCQVGLPTFLINATPGLVKSYDDKVPSKQ